MKINKFNFRFSGLEKTLISWFVLISFVPLIIISMIGYYNSRAIITKTAQNLLKFNTRVETTYLNTFTSKVITELEIIAKNKSNLKFLKDISIAFKQSGKPLKDFIDSYAWLEIVDEGGKDIEAFQKTQGYYNILLIDPKGNLIFSVAREEYLGRNIFTKGGSGTLLARAVATVLREGEIAFSDFEYSPGSKNLLSGFFVRDMINDAGKRIGFIAIQITSDQLRSSIAKETGQSENLSLYLIGEDFMPRFGASLENEYLEINKSIDTELTRYWYDHHILHGMTEHEHERKVLSYTNPSGKEVLGFATHIGIVDKNFVLVAEIEKEDAYQAATWLQNIMIAITFFIVVIVILIAAKIARHIVTPVKNLTQSVSRVASGNYDEVIDITSDNEIGLLAQSYNSMVGNLKKNVQTMENEILKRKHLEKKAKQALETTRMILESLPVGVVIVGKDKNIKFINKAALDMMKLDTPQKIIGSICHDNICPAQKGKCPIYDLGQEVNNSEQILLTSDHKEVPILKTCIPIVLEEKNVLLETFVDITERKESEHQMEQNLKKISEANRRLGVLVSGTTEREKRMVLLKQEVNDLLSRSGHKLKYEAPQKIKEQGFTI